mgnify:CR=1 FL=1
MTEVWDYSYGIGRVLKKFWVSPKIVLGLEYLWSEESEF